MAGNPLNDPHWPAQLADRVVGLVGSVRDRTTTPIVKATRAVVYGLLAALLGVLALVLVLVLVTRAVQSLLDIALSWERSVYLSYLLIGGILCLGGTLLLRKRRAPEV